ncbi:hypothetical protein [Mycobacterium spongiae]|uniref:Uncharacterized protein n=1 Tax=Mycobacterium spongiae TaxID=886343 RepID=A0A975JVZ3_9MYCO|nr:hypothetical protein [Mycobacterium spongiae]QUR66350.1 hypothetical protein F6B93_03935 [Mycobacterium spongiae]
MPPKHGTQPAPGAMYGGIEEPPAVGLTCVTDRAAPQDLSTVWVGAGG